MIGFGKTDLGSTRLNNEDSIYVSNERVGPLENLYIISDGMGGHNAGEVASGKAIEFFVEHIKSYEAELRDEDILNLMMDAVRYANSKVYYISCQDQSMSGMGTTFTAATFVRGRCYIAHLGDSRAYVIKPDGMSQITIDHTYVNDLVRASIISDEQARTHHLRNVITRALGSESSCDVDPYSVDVEEGDRFLLCSDGLSTMLEDSQIEPVVASDTGLKAIASRLIDMANEHGGVDNISVILIGEGGLGHDA
ncbi:MAG: Stp1/IreP family PP2C-type Ser/Thr phosphatase [Defluviitaleaceae bacterium]|nr:Stp1/IreP family PP2C-type Ser/Thr phosphatase [Defluviitaleaceae bacterium]